jgi:hypothetical protein
MRIDSSGKVGIGTTTTSAAMLNIVNSNDDDEIRFRGTPFTSIISESTSGMSLTLTQSAFMFFATSNTERMRIDSSGRVMIGTTSTSDRLTSQNTDAINLNYTVSNGTLGLNNSANAGNANALGASIIFRQRYAADTVIIQSAAIVSIKTSASGNFGGGLAFYSQPASGADMFEVMRYNSAGNVGIGTTDPGAKVEINGTGELLRFEGSAGNRSMYFRNVGTGNTAKIFADGILTLETNVATPITFNTQSSERARITDGGNLLIGKSADNDTTLGVRITSGIVNSAGSTDFWNSYSTTASVYRFYVTSAGTVTATNTTISAISDQRFKEKIVDLDVGLDAVMALKPRKFDWKEGKGKDIKGDRGFIAQEFEQVFPDLIDEWKDPAPEGEEPYKAVRQDLIPILVKAIQEQQAIITQLQADVAALKGAK